MLPQHQHIDRKFARLIAYKRLMTASLSLAAAVVLAVATVIHGGAPPLPFALAMALFVGGGVWTLRTGLRLLRDLRQ